jgi:hypothetical protein
MLVGAAPGDDHARLDLVEDEDGAVLRRQLPDALQVAGLGRHDADVELHRLDQDGRDLPGVRFQDGGEHVGLVERRDDRLGDARARDAGAGRHGGG